MKQEDIELLRPAITAVLQEEFCKIQDRSDRAASDTVSSLINDLRKDIARVESKIDDMKPKLDLIYPKVTGDIRKEEVWSQIRGMFRSGSGVILTLAATGAALAIILGWGKQTLIQWLRQ